LGGIIVPYVETYVDYDEIVQNLSESEKIDLIREIMKQDATLEAVNKMIYRIEVLGLDNNLSALDALKMLRDA
jgi:hypothetical protein